MADTDPTPAGFLSRWSRRKVQVQQGLPVADAVTAVAVPAAMPPATPPLSMPAVPAAAAPGQPAPSAPAAGPATTQADATVPAPTLQEAQRLTTADDFSRFIGRGVDPQVQNTALRTLFSDPHFNVMDGLDVYIDDYGKPDPLPPGMLRQLVQSTMLGLFDDEPKDNPPDAADCGATAVAVADPAVLPATPALPDPPPHEDTALQLQTHDDAGPAGDRAGTCEDAGRQR